jgi:hypothetical protein
VTLEHEVDVLEKEAPGLSDDELGAKAMALMLQIVGNYVITDEGNRPLAQRIQKLLQQRK